jgi:hypothetical protein
MGSNKNQYNILNPKQHLSPRTNKAMAICVLKQIKIYEK